ncbi:MAG: YncE family protein, partial [Caldisericum sp.]|uniref:YncE family protein n=1 Tax=Caldisericum sp. TaxID=2499687 RepID=UPI003D0E0A73
MLKGSSSKKSILFEVLVVLVVFSFVATSFAVTGFNHDSRIKGDMKGNISYTPLTNSSNSNPGYVKYTLVLSNNSLINGNFVTLQGLYPIGAAFDSFNGYVYVTNALSDSVSVINGATNTVIANIPVGSNPRGTAFDSSNGYVYVT